MAWRLREYNEKYDLTKNNDAEVNTQLADLIKHACEQTGCRVVVLIDEYDASLPDVLHEEENLPVLRNVMRTADTLYVIELKLNKSVDAALSQINLKNYPERFALCGLPVVKVGINIDSESHALSDWIIEG